MKRMWMWMAGCAGLAALCGVRGADAPATQNAEGGIAPTLLTLHYHDAPAEKVLADFFGQIHKDYQLFPIPDHPWSKVSIDMDHRPYWEAAAALDAALGANIHLWEGGKMAVSGGAANDYDAEHGQRYVSGACILVAQEVRHEVHFTQRDGRETCAVEMMLLVEPGVNIALYPKRVEAGKAVDELGNSLVLAVGADSEHLVPVEDNTYIQFEIPLNAGGKTGRRIAELSGAVHLRLVQETRKIEIAAEDFSRTKSADFFGATLTINPIKTETLSSGEEGTNYGISVDVARNDLDDLAWARVNRAIDGSHIAILDAKGKPYYGHGGGGGHSKDVRTVRLTVGSAEGFHQPETNAGPAVKCVMELPGAMRDAAVPFAFKNLPLP